MKAHWSQFTKYIDAFKYIQKYKPKLIVEYGGGQSTFCINQLLDELDYGGRVVAFESEKEWMNDHTEKGFNRHGSIHLVPITMQCNIKGHLRYEHSLEGLEKVDFIILDGPDYKTYPVVGGTPSNLTTNIDDLVEIKGEPIPYFIDGRSGCVNYYRAKYPTEYHIKQLTRE